MTALRKNSLSLPVILARSAGRRPSRLLLLMPMVPLLLCHPAWGQEEGKARPLGIRITSPRPVNSRGEWLPPEPGEGFLSTTLIDCSAELAGKAEGVTIRWRATVFRGGKAAGTITGAGSRFAFRPADAARRQQPGPIAVEIAAEAVPPERSQPADAGADPHPSPPPGDRVRIEQDEIDQLRQEYLDLPGRKVALAPRQAFIDRSTYESQKLLTFPWPALNRTRRPDGACYSYILMTDALREGLRRWQEQLGSRGLTISSGFRNPIKQRLTNSRGGRDGAPGSMHQYGRAVDVQASLRRDFRDWVQVAWAALDAGADYVETAPEGGWSHVHADWRHDGQGPALTVKVEITGRVVDIDGKPVATARVLGASDAAGGVPGMPAWEGPDAEGRFVLRTVWRPGKPYRVRAWTERESATQVITVPEAPGGLVRLETELVLAPDEVRAALARRRSVRLASRGKRGDLSQRTRARRK